MTTLPSAIPCETVDFNGNPVLMWECVKCREFLGTQTGPSLVALRAELIRLPTDPEGLPAYGLPPRAMRGKDARVGNLLARPRLVRERMREAGESRSRRVEASAERFLSEDVQLPILAYCPRAGVCGKAQRIG